MLRMGLLAATAFIAAALAARAASAADPVRLGTLKFARSGAVSSR